MPVWVVAKDKKEQLKAYQIEECVDYGTATKVKEYVKSRVDQDKWMIDTSYSNTGMPAWDKGQMHEAANAPKEGE